MQNIYVVFGDGFEEIEAITVIDILRRAQFNVKTVSLDGRSVKGAQNIRIEMDESIETLDIQLADAIIFPGGEPNSTLLAENPLILDLVSKAFESNIWLGAICAAPKIFDAAGILNGVPFTSYPALESSFDPELYRQQNVVVDESTKVVTSRGIGTSIEFALTWVRLLKSAQLSRELAQAMVVA